MNENIIFEPISYDEANYKSPLSIGVATGVRIRDKENGIIIISLNEKDQLRNKEKAFDILQAKTQLDKANAEVEGLSNQNKFLEEQREILDKEINELAQQNTDLTQRNKELSQQVLKNARIQLDNGWLTIKNEDYEHYIELKQRNKELVEFIKSCSPNCFNGQCKYKDSKEYGKCMKEHCEGYQIRLIIQKAEKLGVIAKQALAKEEGE